MKSKKVLMSALVAGLIWLGSSEMANAGGGCGYGYGFGGNPFSFSYGFGFGGSPYGLGYVPVPPYFAIHPPVYYGERYYRPYGASPFASSSQLNTNERYRPEPRADFVPISVSNPYCASGDCGASVESNIESPVAKHSAEPQMIENPFCKRTADASDSLDSRLVSRTVDR